MNAVSLCPTDVSSRRTLRREVLLALYEVAGGSPAARVPITTLANLLKVDRRDALDQLCVLEGLGMTEDVDQSGASLRVRGILWAEATLSGDPGTMALQ